MQNSSLEEMRSRANRLASEGAKWHFHILTPGCDLNESEDFVLVLESAAENVLLAHCSSEMEKGMDVELVKLLHGDDVLQQETTAKNYQPSEDAKKIINRIKELSDADAQWHHHMLFPDCRFNKYQPKWALMLEDKENGDVLVSLSDEEPKNDLKQIEALFYKH